MKELSYICEIEKYKPIYFILYKFNEHTCRGRHLKGVVFLQYLISCKIKKIFEKITEKFVKFCNLQQKLNMRK